MLECISHNRNMARRGIPKQVNWYLREWMEATEGFRGHGGQARMMRETGWSKATMSQLYNGKQDYSPKVMIQAAKALHAETWELLMPPERAMAMRRLRADALRIVQDTPPPATPRPAPRAQPLPRKRKSG